MLDPFFSDTMPPGPERIGRPPDAAPATQRKAVSVFILYNFLVYSDSTSAKQKVPCSAYNTDVYNTDRHSTDRDNSAYNNKRWRES